MRIQQSKTTPSTHPTMVAPLPPTVSVKTAAMLFRVSRTAAYRAAKARLAGDEFDGLIWPRGAGLIWPQLAGELSGW